MPDIGETVLAVTRIASPATSAAMDGMHPELPSGESLRRAGFLRRSSRLASYRYFVVRPRVMGEASRVSRAMAGELIRPKRDGWLPGSSEGRDGVQLL